MKKVLVVMMLLIVMGIQSVPSASACWYGKCTSVKRSNGCINLYRKTPGVMDQYVRGWCRYGIER
jgi:hypothetical protein